MTKVSVCIPAYLHVDLLERCIQSVLAQNFKDFEVVVTDDSPNDIIQERIKLYQDDRIRYFKNVQTLGSPANWNECVLKAKGEYIKILHHDDWFSTPFSLGTYVDLLNDHPESDIAFSASCDISASYQKVHSITPAVCKKISEQPESLFLGNVIGAPSVSIFRNNKNLLFDTQLIWLVDTDFYIRSLQQNHQFAYTNNVLVNIGISDFQITRSCLEKPEVRIKEKLYLYKKFELEKKQSIYKRSLLRTLGREKIFSNSKLGHIIPECKENVFRPLDSFKAYYFYTKKKIREILVLVIGGRNLSA